MPASARNCWPITTACARMAALPSISTRWRSGWRTGSRPPMQGIWPGASRRSASPPDTAAPGRPAGSCPAHRGFFLNGVLSMTGPIPDHQIDVSFELFPPKTDAGLAKLNGAAGRLAEVGPEYFSVTYGAGGSTRARTAEVVRTVRQSTGLPVAHHLTCVGASRAEIDAQAQDLWNNGIRRIVALRGDLPEG